MADSDDLVRISHFLTTLQNIRKAPDHPNNIVLVFHYQWEEKNHIFITNVLKDPLWCIAFPSFLRNSRGNIKARHCVTPNNTSMCSSNREALNFVPGISRQQTTVRTKAHSVCGQLLQSSLSSHTTTTTMLTVNKKNFSSRDCSKLHALSQKTPSFPMLVHDTYYSTLDIIGPSRIWFIVSIFSN